jgi:hypothetical protein
VLQDPLDAQFSQALDRVVAIHAVVASILQTMPSSVATSMLLLNALSNMVPFIIVLESQAAPGILLTKRDERLDGKFQAEYGCLFQCGKLGP